jgi:hypothetical protein
LKQLKTGLFLTASDRWTRDHNDAIDFKTTPAALDYSQRHHYFGTSIVLKFRDAGYDIELKNS